MQLVERLPQTLEQLGTQLRQRQAEGAIRMDTRENPAAAVAETTLALDDTVQHLADVSRSLHQAASPLFHMAAR